MIKILMPLMDKFTPTCEVVTHRLSESMDHKLPLRVRLQVNLHLMFCKFCSRYRDQLLAIQKMLRNFDPSLSEEHLSEVASTRIKNSLKDHNCKP